MKTRKLVLILFSFFAIACQEQNNNGSNKASETPEGAMLQDDGTVAAVGNGADEFRPAALSEEQEKVIAEIYGTWRIVKYEAGQVSAISDEEAERYIGRSVLLTRELVVIDGDSCKSPVFDLEVVRAQDYLYNSYRFARGLPGFESDRLEVLNILCFVEPAYRSQNSMNFDHDIIIMNKELIVSNLRGVFFYLEKPK